MTKGHNNISINSKIVYKLYVQKIQEYIRYNKYASILLLTIYLIKILISKYVKNDNKYYKEIGNIFRHINNKSVRQLVTYILVNAINQRGAATLGDIYYKLCKIDQGEVSRLRDTLLNCKKPFDSRMLILAPPAENKKGVILLKYTNYIKYFLEIFDLNKFKERYVLILEPSSCGYFDEDIMCLLGRMEPVIIQSPEDVDKEFLRVLNNTFVPIDIGANYWVDHRVFFPIENTIKEYDLVMVALWGSVKRHYRLFAELSKIKPEERPKIALVGVPWPMSIDEIRDIARYYKVDDSIEYFEGITQNHLNKILNKSKTILLLSKKEGVCKAIIEGMFANIPAFILEGFNFGTKYSYLNDKTGGYVSDKRLKTFLQHIDTIIEKGNYSPFQWVKEHMSFECATEKLKKVLDGLEIEHGLKINKDLVYKINNPNLDYFDPSNWNRFENDYRELGCLIKNS